MRALFFAVFAAVLLGCGGSGTDKFMELNVIMSTQTIYSPHEILAVPGQAVIFRNEDLKFHTVTPDEEGRGPNSEIEYPDAIAPSLTYTFVVPVDSLPGDRFPFHCRFHGEPGSSGEVGTGMAGVIIVMGQD